jgi:hypothetical protein
LSGRVELLVQSLVSGGGHAEFAFEVRNLSLELLVKGIRGHARPSGAELLSGHVVRSLLLFNRSLHSFQQPVIVRLQCSKGFDQALDVLNGSLLLELFDLDPEVSWQLVLGGDAVETLRKSVRLQERSVLVVVNGCLLFLPVELHLQLSSEFFLQSSDLRRDYVPELVLDHVVSVNLSKHGLKLHKILGFRGFLYCNHLVKVDGVVVLLALLQTHLYLLELLDETLLVRSRNGHHNCLARL